LPVALYGYETWSLTLREEHRLRVFEDRVLRIIFGPKRDEVIGGWIKLHNEELHNLCYLPSIIRMIKSRMIRWAGHAARIGRRGVHIWFWGKRPLGRPRRRLEDNTKMDLREIGWGGMDWIDLGRDRDQCRGLVNTVMNFRVLYMLGNSWVAGQLAASQEGLRSMELVSYSTLCFGREAWAK
jgi:hypothetical protein